jgi:hypothetical protein
LTICFLAACITTVKGVGVRATTTHAEQAVEATASCGIGLADVPGPGDQHHVGGGPGTRARLIELEGGLGVARHGGAEGHVSEGFEYIDFGTTRGWHTRVSAGGMFGEYSNVFGEASAGMHWNLSQSRHEDEFTYKSIALDLIAGYAQAGEHADPSGAGGFAGFALSYRLFHQNDFPAPSFPN